MEYTISEKLDGATVKDFLNTELRLSKKMITRLKQIEGGITLNGQKVTVRAKLKNGDLLSLLLEHESKQSTAIEPVKLSLDVLYEDEYYIVINKPPHMPVHPSHNHRNDTLANALSYRYQKDGAPFVFRAVNRLDKDTSGIVIFAKSADSAYRFSKMHKNDGITKRYLALVRGICDDAGSIEGYIRRKEKSVITREFLKDKIDESCAYSHTEYKTIARGNDASLLSLLLHTGRTHQIRVHTQSIGHSVLGDDLYGEKDSFERQMLHAYEISFVHPYTNKEIRIKAELADDMVTAIKKKGIEYDF